jgi:2-methylcitrate dehydratase PrpD
MKKTTDTIAQFITDTCFDDIPANVIGEAKKVLLDCIGITVAGSLEPAGKIITEFVKERGGRPEASVVRGGFKTSVLEAALANGVMAHALDFDDGGHVNLPLSRSVAVLPAALACGELVGATGKDVLLGYILGFDLISKVSDGMSGKHYEWGWQTTGTVCTLGAVAAAAKILNLSRGETSRALGIGGSGAGGLRQNNGTMTKPLHAGNAARNGVLAALLAKQGFTGTEEVFEGEFGFCQCFCGSEGYDLDKMTENLGTRYEFVTPGVGIKRYPACMSNHRSLDAIFNIMNEHKFSAEEVEKVECGVSRDVIDHLFYLNPQSALEGKFSLQYCMAAALLDGKVGLGQFIDERVRDSHIHEFMNKIHVYEHPETRNLSRNDQFSEITVQLKDGQIFSNRVKLVRGRPGNPLGYDEIVAKYRECAGMVLPNESVTQLLDTVEHIEELDKISRLTDIMC